MDETAADSATSPVIGLPACRQTIGDQIYHVVGEKYLTAAATAAGGVPLTLPALGDEKDFSAILDRLDGLLVTGSPSNVEPHHYDGPASADGTHHDPSRDDTMLPLIPAAIAAHVPVLAICRGIQELNVALGGTLHQRIEDMPGKLNHQADPADPIETRYGRCTPSPSARRAFWLLSQRRWASIFGLSRSIHCIPRASTAWPRGLPSTQPRRTGLSRRFGSPMPRPSP